MDTKSLSKKIVWLLVTIIIGALGSGLWETILKPSLAWISTLALDIATLGLNSLRDGIYESAARGNYERTAIEIYAIMTGVLIGIIISLPILLYSKKDKKRENLSEISKDKAKRIWPAATFAIAYALFSFIQLFRVSYISLAANHVDQMTAIVSPYVTPAEIIKFKSRFAQIDTRRDYVILVEDLKKIAKQNSARTPKFNIY